MTEETEVKGITSDIHFKFKIKDLVKHTNGSLHGEVVGFYSTPKTPEGYVVMSHLEKGLVHVNGSNYLEPWDGRYILYLNYIDPELIKDPE